MAHYAFLDKNNVVTDVITGIDETELIEGKDPETWYGEFRGQTCKRTSYNTRGGKHLNGGIPFRGNYASIGGKYDRDFDVFIPLQPYPSWKLNYKTFLWEAPIPYPDKDNVYSYKWSEINQEWIKLQQGEINE